MFRFLIVAIIIALSFGSCCPKIVPMERTVDSTTTETEVDRNVEVSDSAKASMMLDSLLDLINTAKRDTVQIRVPVWKVTNNGVSANLYWNLKEEKIELEGRVDSLLNVKDKVKRTVVKEKVKEAVFVCNSGWHKFLNWWFFGSLVFVALLFIFASRR